MPRKWYPSHSRYDQGNENYLWISIKPRKLSYTNPVENTNLRANIDTIKDNSLTSFMFLAPEELQDNVAHNWEPLENLISRISDKVGQAQQSISMSTEVHKVDTALIYQDSNRREISFTVNLAVYDNPDKDVFEPIRLLREYSAPSLKGTASYQTEVGNPFIFKVDTVIGTSKVVPLINIKHAALVAVQPTYKHPYIQGYPSSCELTLTFKDMEPLSKDTFTMDGTMASFERVTTEPDTATEEFISKARKALNRIP